MQKAYKIKNTFTTVTVKEIHYDLYKDTSIVVLEDGLKIPEKLFTQLYNAVDEKTMGDNKDIFKDNVVPFKHSAALFPHDNEYEEESSGLLLNRESKF
jgi:hypothetical protein